MIIETDRFGSDKFINQASAFERAEYRGGAATRRSRGPIGEGCAHRGSDGRFGQDGVARFDASPVELGLAACGGLDRGRCLGLDVDDFGLATPGGVVFLAQE